MTHAIKNKHVVLNTLGKFSIPLVGFELILKQFIKYLIAIYK